MSPGPTPNLSLSRYSQCSSPGKLSESSLSKHLTCVSRTYSQPQPVEILLSIPKPCHLRQSIDKSPSTNDLTANMPKVKQKHTSSESRILKLFDALDFTSAACTNLVIDFRILSTSSTRIPAQKIQELNTNDLSFTLDGVLSTLQQGSAENGVGSSVELRYHVEKAPCTDLRSDPTLHPKFLQNYAGGRVRQPRTPNTSAERKFPKPN